MITREKDRLDIGTDERNRLDRILTRFRSSLGGHANSTGAARGGSLRASLAEAQDVTAAVAIVEVGAATSGCPRCGDSGRVFGGLWYSDTPPSAHLRDHRGFYYQYAEPDASPDSDWSGPYESRAQALRTAVSDYGTGV